MASVRLLEKSARVAPAAVSARWYRVPGPAGELQSDFPEVPALVVVAVPAPPLEALFAAFQAARWGFAFRCPAASWRPVELDWVVG